MHQLQPSSIHTSSSSSSSRPEAPSTKSQNIGLTYGAFRMAGEWLRLILNRLILNRAVKSGLGDWEKMIFFSQSTPWRKENERKKGYGELQFQCRDPQTGNFFFKNRKTGKTYKLVK
jgi:hypothetical protein